MVGINKDFTLLIVFLSIVVLFGCEGERQSANSSKNAEINSAQTEASQSAELVPSDLREAALNGALGTVRDAIDQGMDVREPDELGRTPLMFAAFNGHTDIIKILVQEGADIKDSNSEGRTPLMFAASGPFPETVEYLLQQGADPNAKDEVEGWTPLMYAAAEGNREVVELLLEYGANPNLEDTDGETALDFASDNGHSDVVTLLDR